MSLSPVGAESPTLSNTPDGEKRYAKMSLKNLKARKSAGFTLIEIMIVVLIIGILLAIAVPNFVKARESSRQKSCIANLRQIDSAKQQWAMDNKQAGTASPLSGVLVGTGGYLKSYPTCPAGGSYTIGTVDADPTCDYTGNAAYPHGISALAGSGS